MSQNDTTEQPVPTKFRFLTTLLMLLSAFACMSPATQAAPASLRTERYIVPLVKDFAIQRADLELRHNDYNLFQLVQSNGLSSWGEPIPSVTTVAVHGELILGETTDSFFVFDTAVSEPTPQFYKTRESWQARLIALGIPKSISLSTPDTLAAGLPNRTLRPWEYRVMHGWLGQSDDDWEGITIISGWFVAFVVGWYLKKRRSILLISILIGSFTNIFGRIIIGGEGPAAGVGFFLEPVVCCVTMAFGRGIRTAFGPRRPPLKTSPVGSALADGISPP